MAVVNVIAVFLLSVELGQASCSYDYSKRAEVLRASDGRVRGVSQRQEVDFLLGGLFVVHTSIHTTTPDGKASCGPIRTERGLERAEAMMYALDCINSDETLLPGIRLGYDIRDTCASESVGLDESIDLVVLQSSCSNSYQPSAQNTSQPIHLPATAVIGATSSAVTVPTAKLMRLYSTPQVSYGASSPILSDQEKYKYFFRTIPADELQVRAMVDLLLHFNWTYVSAIYANDFYGNPGIAEFRKIASEHGICLDVVQSLDPGFTNEDYQSVALNLINSSSANVVLVIASQDEALQFFTAFNATRPQRPDRRFLWIASDAWAHSLSVVSLFSESLTGLFGFVPLTNFKSSFNQYLSLLTLDSNLRDPWFAEFFEAVFECQVNSTCNHSQPITEHQGYEHGQFVPLVIDAVYSVAHALNNFLNANCDQPVVWHRNNSTCDGQKQRFDGPALAEYIRNVSFISPTGNVIEYDDNGNIEGSYEIVNYQQSVNPAGSQVEYSFVSVGQWSSLAVTDPLSLKNSGLQFGLDENGPILTAIDSHCPLCGPGKVRQEVESSCCWTCDSCLGRNFSNGTSNLACQVCEEFTWGNNPFVGSNSCVALEDLYFSYNHPWAIALIVMAILGLLLALAVAIIMGKFWGTPMVKMSGREHLVILLVSVVLLFLLACLFVFEPSDGLCVFRVYGLWLTFSLVLGSIFVRLVQIARASLSKETTQTRCTRPGWQVLFVLLIVFGEFLLTVISLVVTPSFVERTQSKTENSLDFPTVVLTCQSPHFVLLSLLITYNSLIITASIILATITIKYPANFNEVKYIASATFLLGIMWVCLIPTYIVTTNVFHAGAVALVAILSGSAILVCIFVPRMLIMIFFPQWSTVECNVTACGKQTNDLLRLDKDAKVSQGNPVP